MGRRVLELRLRCVTSERCHARLVAILVTQRLLVKSIERSRGDPDRDAQLEVLWARCCAESNAAPDPGLAGRTRGWIDGAADPAPKAPVIMVA